MLVFCTNLVLEICAWPCFVFVSLCPFEFGSHLAEEEKAGCCDLIVLCLTLLKKKKKKKKKMKKKKKNFINPISTIKPYNQNK